MRLKPESGAIRIKSADDAYSFMMYMRLSYRNKPHWQVARQALNHAGASDAGEIQAWRTFRAAAEAEGWLVERSGAQLCAETASGGLTGGFPRHRSEVPSSISRIGVGLMEPPANLFKWRTLPPEGEHHELRRI